MHWPGSLRAEYRKCLTEQLGELPRGVDGDSECREGSRYGVLVDDLVENAPPFAVGVGRRRRRDHEEWNRVRIRLTERRGGIGDSWPRDHKTHTRSTARSAIPVGHEGRSLFVASSNMGDGTFGQSSVQSQVVRTWDAKNGVNPVLLEEPNNRFAAAHRQSRPIARAYMYGVTRIWSTTYRPADAGLLHPHRTPRRAGI